MSEPVDKMPTNTKCPSCGYVTADPLNCVMCAEGFARFIVQSPENFDPRERTMARAYLRLLPTGAAGERCLVCRAPSQAECAGSDDELCGPFVASTPAREPVAWMTPDGKRVVPASTKRGGEDDGGAMRSSLAVYSIPLYTHPPTPEAGTVTEAMALAAAREHAAQMGESFDAMWDQMDERERAKFVIDWSVILRKALAGRRGA